MGGARGGPGGGPGGGGGGLSGLTGLQLRVVSSLGMGAVGALALCNAWTFAVGLAGLSYLCAVEYLEMHKAVKGLKKSPALIRESLKLTCVGVILGTQAGIRTGLFEVGSFVLLSMLLLKKAYARKKKKRRVRLSQIAGTIFGLFYCGYLPSFWVRVRQLDSPLFGFTEWGPLGRLLVAEGVEPQLGMMATILPTLCIIAADSGAYFVGKALGRTKLISISPNKTVEGAGGGLLSSVGICLLFAFLIGWPQLPVAAALGGIVFVASLFGDLIESSMKRDAGLKDASGAIPGHGGVLDRFDSYMFTGVLVYCFWYWYLWSTGQPISAPLLR